MIPILLAVASALVWMPKWWRVAQREHYLPGSVNSTLFRWLETTPVPNMGLVWVGWLVRPSQSRQRAQGGSGQPFPLL